MERNNLFKDKSFMIDPTAYRSYSFRVVQRSEFSKIYLYKSDDDTRYMDELLIGVFETINDLIASVLKWGVVLCQDLVQNKMRGSAS